MSRFSSVPSTATPFPSSSIDAAALQAEMAKKYGVSMPGMRTNAGGRGSRRNAQRSKENHTNNNSVNGATVILCESCGHKNVGNELANSSDPAAAGNSSSSSAKVEHCMNCGYFFPVVTQAVASLAQRRGLMLPYGQVASALTQKAEREAMKPLEWYVLEGHLQRKVDPDCCCPICMEKSTSGEEVLLSCGHIFHKVCLRSFENFMKTADMACPLCRTKNYQKKLTNLGTIGHQKYCAKKIQAIYRGYVARKQFKQMLRRYYRSGKGDENRRKKYFEHEFTMVSRKIDQSVDTRATQVNSLLRSMEQTLDQSRQLDMLFEQMLLNRMNGTVDGNNIAQEAGGSLLGTTVEPDVKAVPSYGTPLYDPLESCAESNSTWQNVLNQAMQRGACDCAICMIPMTMTLNFHDVESHHSTLMQQHNQKKSVLLSCTHLFHESCLSSFERFSRNEKLHCPICRSCYSKRLLPH